MADTAAPSPTGVLLVSAWCEGVPPRVAARIIHTLDVTDPERVMVTASGVDAIAAVVRRWLVDLECAPADPVTRP